MTTFLSICDAIEHVNMVSGTALNSILLHFIHRFSRKDLGEYKLFLSAFASFDIFLCFLHWSVAPVRHNVTVFAKPSAFIQRVLSYGSSFCVVATCFWENRHITRMYVSMFTVPFGTLNINFLYRYWSIKNPVRLMFFSKRYFKLFLLMYAFSVYSFWHWLSWWGTAGELDEPATVKARAIYLDKYNKTIIDGWLIVEYWVRNYISNSASN
ncbi:hypothetical protein PENTCL1PPCAC_20674 [Pristionchus entomophagus]|uniref:G protein-coupled receptor n=1 Tax=Pristionchus entomophagus TaxID=358040 RepID=A0AAV5TX05_9BILA|nr:hypothetical protein PENTCL1PPCAC_20674 [Pristionchus entomophagus]